MAKVTFNNTEQLLTSEQLSYKFKISAIQVLILLFITIMYTGMDNECPILGQT